MSLSKILTRGTPVIVASTFLHIGVAAALVVGTAGHRAAAPVTSLEISLDLTELPAAAPEEEETPEAKAPVATPEAHPAAPAHTHPYEVPPSHDAHPHDPSIDHHAEHGASPPAPAEAPPALAAQEPAPVMPRFTIAIGNSNKPASANVATGASGSGGTNVTGGVTTPTSEAPVPESVVSKRATLATSVVAAYPIDARQGELEADVPVEIVVDTTGRVVEARVVQRAGSGFDESALSAIKRYRFHPAERDGRAVSVRMRWSVQFRLR